MQKVVEPIVINYDKNGMPTTVVLHHGDYLQLVQPSNANTEIDIRKNRFKMAATGYYVDPKAPRPSFCVLKGSKAARYEEASLKDCHKELRQKLIEQGILVKISHGDYEFTQDYEFASPSAAICVIEGTSKSGTEAWGKP